MATSSYFDPRHHELLLCMLCLRGCANICAETLLGIYVECEYLRQFMHSFHGFKNKSFLVAQSSCKYWILSATTVTHKRNVAFPYFTSGLILCQ